jgi:signal transduction histidine kinase
MLIIASGTFVGGLLYCFNITSPSFPYDILTVNNISRSPEVMYTLFARIILSISFFLPAIIVFKSDQPSGSTLSFKQDSYLVIIAIALIVLIIGNTPNPLLPLLAFTKVLLFIEPFGILDQAIYFLAVFIYCDVRASAHKNLFSKFTIGLIILAVGQLFYINPNLIQYYGILAHLSRFIGFLLIFCGLDDFALRSSFVKFRQELLAYLSLFLILGYVVFVSFASIIYSFEFPASSNYIFLGFFIISMTIQYILVTGFTKPLDNIIEVMDKYNPKEKLETMPILFDDEIGKLTCKLNDIIDLSWNYSQELLVQKQLIQQSKDKERILSEIVTDTQNFDEHDRMYNYVLFRFINLFGTNRCIHLHCDGNNNLFVKNEITNDEKMESLLYKIVFYARYTTKILPEDIMTVIAINDVEKEILDPELKEFLLSNDIQAYLFYSTGKVCKSSDEKEHDGSIIISTAYPKEWKSEEIDFFKLIVDTTSIIYSEIQQRQGIEELKKTFLSALTHDLRSPLFAIQKALEVILLRKTGTTLEDFAEYLEDIYKTNEELLILVNNILSISHYEAGKAELNVEKSNLAELITSSIKMIQYLAKDQGSEIIVNIEKDLPDINVDKIEIKRVLTNLITNAVKHNQKGTIVSVFAKRIDEQVEVKVQDNGKGILESEKQNIFDKYPTKKRNIGSGLGLYISKQIIESHNGKIWFESEEGKGTTFYFTLPINGLEP